MDCDVCDIRSSVGFCHDCKKLVCEVCGIECAACSKLLCEEHIEETRHGRKLCAECMAERRARRHRKKGGKDAEEGGAHSFAALDGGEGLPEDDETVDDALDERVLLVSGHSKRDPWLRSLYLTAPGAVLMLLMMSFPLVHYIVHPWPPLVALVWGVLGFVRGVLGFYTDKYHERIVINVIVCCVAFVVCITCLVLLLYAEAPYALWSSLGVERAR